jgi:hypothetical protein
LKNGSILPNTSAGSLTAAQTAPAPAVKFPIRSGRVPIQWTFGVQHAFHNDYSFESRYMGTRGTNLTVQDRPQHSGCGQPVECSSAVLHGSGAGDLKWSNQHFGCTEYPTGKPREIIPAYLNAGFTSNIVGCMPYGNSSYNGWANQLTRRFSNGLQLIAAYTWSHNIDNSTADLFSTYTAPRRPENFQNISGDRSDSAPDHRNRFSFQTLYDMPLFKHDTNWFKRNIVGNWEVAPVYQYQTGTWVTLQSAIDSNMNGIRPAAARL